MSRSFGHSTMSLALYNPYAHNQIQVSHDENNNHNDESLLILLENYTRHWPFFYEIERRLLNFSSTIPVQNIDIDLVSSPTSSLDLPPFNEREIFFILNFIRYLQSIDYFNSSPSLLAICNHADAGAIQMAAKRTNVNSVDEIRKKAKNEKNNFFHHHQPTPGLCGLVNIGNTCFMNSALQCLSNIPDLTQWSKDKQNLSIKCLSVTQAYISLIRSMWSGEYKYVTPRDVKNQVSRSASIFCDYAQKDSHEFMNSLLNALHMELIDRSCFKQQSSIVTDLFQIKTESQVTCLTCQDCDKNEETTFCLPLPLIDQNTDLTLDQLLAEFLKEDNLDGDYFCLKCESLQFAKQKTNLLLLLPRVIIVQLKRFRFDDTSNKIETFVRYPLVNWSPMGSMQGPYYNLASVSRHVGNLNGGHYTAFARLNGNGDWYHFNDTHYELVDDLSCIVTPNAYLLIYLRND